MFSKLKDKLDIFSNGFSKKLLKEPESKLMDGIKSNFAAVKTNLDDVKTGIISDVEANLLKRIKKKAVTLITQGVSSVFALTAAFPIPMVTILVLILLLIIWYFFFNDRSIVLAFKERLGRGVSRFSGKVVWLVGASTNLGEAMAHELASSGAKLILTARRTDILKQIKTDCIEKSKGKLSESDIFVLPFDVTEMDKKYVKDAIDHFGKIDVFIDNVGHTELGDASKMDIEVDKALFDVNFFGPVFLAKLMIEHFHEQGGGQIVIVSSISGKFGIPGLASASASKHALQGYFNALRLECRRYKISITIVCPGMVRTSVPDHVVLAGSSKIPHDEQTRISRKGMKTKRCAHLVLVAGANRCYECWVSNQPFLFLTALSQYCPRIHKYLMSFIFSEKRLNKIYQGKSPEICTWKPLFVI